VLVRERMSVGMRDRGSECLKCASEWEMERERMCERERMIVENRNTVC
jgi:hypothetical protein